ncbi:MAG TPA: flagellar basal body P-ring formation chaperone FlgA [Methylomirabilota bacterium]|nr:flagellar basal body P-ring formation chaperone FlgA [Methylomirabilota bacterium]
MLRLLTLLFLAATQLLAAEWTLAPSATVTSGGIFLSDLVTASEGGAVPKLLLTNAPSFHRPALLTRPQVEELMKAADSSLKDVRLTGPARVKVSRKAMPLQEDELLALLADALRTALSIRTGDLELRAVRPWTPIAVADEPLTVRLSDLPTSGLSAHMILRFEVSAGDERMGTFSLAVKVQHWSDVYVADAALVRGQSLRDAPLRTERRDLLTTRDALLQLPSEAANIELAENIRPGSLLTSRSLRLRTVVRRGRVVDALYTESGMKISARVEALEDGVPGQIVRVRNLRSKRELKGKVQDEQTILVMF